MPTPNRRLPMLILLGAVAAAPAVAQPAGRLNPAGGPIDAGVGDRGPHATSLRRVEAGNAQHSFAARITPVDFGRRWTTDAPGATLTTDPRTGLTHSQQFQFRSPGMRALVDRPQYARIQGQTLAIIPANTVFQLTPEAPTPAPGSGAEAVAPPPPAHANYLDRRLNLRLADQPEPRRFTAARTGPAPRPGDRPDTSRFHFPAAAEAAYHRPTPSATAPGAFASPDTTPAPAPLPLVQPAPNAPPTDATEPASRADAASPP